VVELKKGLGEGFGGGVADGCQQLLDTYSLLNNHIDVRYNNISMQVVV
jgi:hypothetical protein